MIYLLTFHYSEMFLYVELQRKFLLVTDSKAQYSLIHNPYSKEPSNDGEKRPLFH